MTLQPGWPMHGMWVTRSSCMWQVSSLAPQGANSIKDISEEQGSEGHSGRAAVQLVACLPKRVAVNCSVTGCSTYTRIVFAFTLNACWIKYIKVLDGGART